MFATIKKYSRSMFWFLMFMALCFVLTFEGCTEPPEVPEVSTPVEQDIIEDPIERDSSNTN